jgi:hypothetical protein
MDTLQQYDVDTLIDMLGKRVVKRRTGGKAPKPFKSGLRINTTYSIVGHPHLPGHLAFTFEEDDSIVECGQCVLAQEEIFA